MKFRATTKILIKAKKLTKTPVVAIGGINSTNYKNLLLNNANFLAISSYMSAAPLNPAYKADEYEFYLKDLSPKIIIVEPNSKNNVVCNAFFFFCEPDHWYFTKGPEYVKEIWAQRQTQK